MTKIQHRLEQLSLTAAIGNSNYALCESQTLTLGIWDGARYESSNDYRSRNSTYVELSYPLIRNQK